MGTHNGSPLLIALASKFKMKRLTQRRDLSSGSYPSLDRPHPDHPVEKFKRSFVRTVGFSLVDAVTILSFVLSILSIVIASRSLNHSIISDQETSKSSARQEQHTREAQSALDASKQSLEKVTTELRDQDLILRKGLEAAQQQRRLLDRSTNAASEMVSKLDVIAGQASAVPILAASITCTTDDKKNELPNHVVRASNIADGRELKAHGLDSLSRNEREMSNRRGRTEMLFDIAPHLDIAPNILYECILTVRNIGDRVQDHYSVFLGYRRTPWSSSVDEGGPWLLHFRDRWAFDKDRANVFDALGEAARQLGVVQVPERSIDHEEGWTTITGEGFPTPLGEGSSLAPITKSDGDNLHFELLLESKSKSSKSYQDWYRDVGRSSSKMSPAEAWMQNRPNWHAGSLVLSIDHGGGVHQWEVQIALGSDFP